MADFNLFGDPSPYQGLLSDQQMGSAQNQGLLSMAAALLQAGGPSLQKHSFGQALGSGFLAGQQGFNQALDQGVRGQMAAIQLAQARQKLGFTQNALSKLLPGQGGAPLQPATQTGEPTNAAGALAQGAAQGDVGPTVSNAARIGQPAPAASGNPIGAQIQSEFQIPGQSAEMSAFQLLNAPDKYFEAMNKAKELPEWVKTAHAAGITDPSKIAQLGRQYIYKNYEYIAPVSVRDQYIDSNGRLQLIPKEIEGAQRVQGPDGSWSYNQVPGASSAIEASTGAATRGRQLNTIMQGVDANNQPVFATGAQMLAGAQTPNERAIVQTESGGNPNAVSPKGAMGAWQVMPNTNANPGFGVAPAKDNSPAELNRVGKDYYNAMVSKYGDPTLGAIAYNMGPGATDNWLKSGGNWQQLPQETRNYVGQVATQTALNSRPQQPAAPAIRPSMGATANILTKQGGEFYDTAVKDGGNIQTHRQLLGEIQSLAANPNNTFGPGTPEVARLKALGQNLGIDMTSAQTAQDVMKKLSSQLVMTQLGVGGTGTDAQLNTLLHGNPNGEMTNQAILKVVPLLGQQLDLKEARANVLNREVAANKNLENVPNLVNQFNRVATPPAVSLGKQMAAASANGTLKDFMAKLTPQQRALLPNVQKLDAMGAF